VLREKVQSLTLIMGEKDAIIKGVELLVREKDQLIGQMQCTNKSKQG
jgi:hypothetical protein